MRDNSRAISSNQNDVHSKLTAIVSKHIANPYLRPIPGEQRRIFESLDERVREFAGPIVLDSCCGTGESTLALAHAHGECLVIGIDKSAARLAKILPPTSDAGKPVFARADCVDIWRLAVQARWPIQHHYIFYPNPWPKARHLQRRWHGHPVFPSLVALAGTLEIRSNWKIYLDEFCAALAIANVAAAIIEPFDLGTPISAFERKYAQSKQRLYRLQVMLDA